MIVSLLKYEQLTNKYITMQELASLIESTSLVCCLLSTYGEVKVKTAFETLLTQTLLNVRKY